MKRIPFPARLLGLALLFCIFAAPALAGRVLILSDLHFTKDTDPAPLLEAASSAAEAGDVLLVLGDMANSGRPHEHEKVLAFLAALRGRTGCPVFVLPGNHDLSGGVSPAEFAALYAAFGYAGAPFRDPAGAGYARFPADGLCLVMLDDNGYDAARQTVMNGAVPDGTLGWLREVLAQLPEGTRVLVCGHYPILPAESGGSDDTAGAAALAGLLRGAKIPLYLCGHRHSNYTLQEGGLRQIGVGVPFSWPACMGVLTETEDGWRYETRPLYPQDSAVSLSMRQEQLSLAARMAEGSLAGTAYEGDREAEAWFVSVFLASMDGTLRERQAALMADPGFAKWQAAEVRSMAKPWILSLVQNPPEDVHRIDVPVP